MTVLHCISQKVNVSSKGVYFVSVKYYICTQKIISCFISQNIRCEATNINAYIFWLYAKFGFTLQNRIASDNSNSCSLLLSY